MLESQYKMNLIKIGSDVAFSADLCYNGTNKKPLPLGSEAARGE